MGRLEVRVCGARNIAQLHRISKPDPYVKINVGTAKETKLRYKTRVIEKSFTPMWNELFKFQIADPDSCQVLFELWDECTFKDDLLGTYNVNVNALKKGVVMDTWAILSGTKVSTTELHLRILAVDFGQTPDKSDTVIQTLEADKLVAPTGQTARPCRPETGVYTGAGVYPGMPQGPPQPVRYGAQPYGAQPSPYGTGPAMPSFSPTPPPTPGYGYNQPYHVPPQAPGPYGYNVHQGPPRPPQPPQGGVQYAYGIPPDM